YDTNGAFSWLLRSETTVDSFTYTIEDIYGATDSATVYVSITGVNSPPLAIDDSYVTYADRSITGNLLTNDLDPDADSLSANINTGTTSYGASFVVNADGSFDYDASAGTFPATGIVTDTFTYAIDDGNSGTSTATVSIKVASGLDDLIIVDTLIDEDDWDFTEGDVSLRDAISYIETYSLDGVLVTFSHLIKGGTITLGLGKMQVSHDVTIDGDIDNDGIADITIDANQASGIFEFTGGNTNLEGLRLINARAQQGAAILARGNLMILDSHFENNTSLNFGGALFLDQGVLNMTGSTFKNNTAPFGAALTSFNSVLTINQSSFEDNTASISGGAILVNNSSITISNSTLNNNVAFEYGGALVLAESDLLLVQSTISGNKADRGAAIESSYSLMNIAHSTIVFNKANLGSAIHFYQDPVLFPADNILNITYSIVSLNTNFAASLNRNIFGNLTNSSYNIFSDPIVVGSDVTDMLATLPQLGALANNGGPTKTHALLFGSAGIDSGDAASVNPAIANGFDQRGSGFDRVVGGDIDIGAFEAQQIINANAFNNTQTITEVIYPEIDDDVDELEIPGIIEPVESVSLIDRTEDGSTDGFFVQEETHYKQTLQAFFNFDNDYEYPTADSNEDDIFAKFFSISPDDEVASSDEGIFWPNEETINTILKKTFLGDEGENAEDEDGNEEDTDEEEDDQSKVKKNRSMEQSSKPAFKTQSSLVKMLSAFMGIFLG
ncbi:MAG: cadherin-like domain-containing protein, partial [Lentisphaeria bacterium]|nr:Ig-like domain-containing protein [Lentisphaeria bacterium]NQZ69043.1 cadherin-like domain-containing protein [Lentisphaeria bacterium]